MKNIFITSLILITITGLLIIGCSDKKSSTGPDNEGSYITATITHAGFDFSAAKSDTANSNNNDGDTIVWSPIDYQIKGGIWFRTRVNPNRTQSLGKVNIYKIASVDTSAAKWDTNPPPLSKDDVVIAQCLDGFVKFQVTAEVDTSNANPDWGIQVKYLFSTLPSFEE